MIGISGRAMLEALASGENDPAKLPSLAKGKLKIKRAALEQALTDLDTIPGIAQGFTAAICCPCLRCRFSRCCQGRLSPRRRGAWLWGSGSCRCDLGEYLLA